MTNPVVGKPTALSYFIIFPHVPQVCMATAIWMLLWDGVADSLRVSPWTLHQTIVLRPNLPFEKHRGRLRPLRLIFETWPMTLWFHRFNFLGSEVRVSTSKDEQGRFSGFQKSLGPVVPGPFCILLYHFHVLTIDITVCVEYIMRHVRSGKARMQEMRGTTSVSQLLPSLKSII